MNVSADAPIACNFSFAALAHPCHLGSFTAQPCTYTSAGVTTSTAGHRLERPVRTELVVALTELFQRVPRFPGARVELPVDLLGLERLMESLQQPELRRGAILDAHVRVRLSVSAKCSLSLRLNSFAGVL